MIGGARRRRRRGYRWLKGRRRRCRVMRSFASSPSAKPRRRRLHTHTGRRVGDRLNKRWSSERADHRRRGRHNVLFFGLFFLISPLEKSLHQQASNRLAGVDFQRFLIISLRGKLRGRRLLLLRLPASRRQACCSSLIHRLSFYRRIGPARSIF